MLTTPCTTPFALKKESFALLIASFLSFCASQAINAARAPEAPTHPLETALFLSSACIMLIALMLVGQILFRAGVAREGKARPGSSNLRQRHIPDAHI